MIGDLLFRFVGFSYAEAIYQVLFDIRYYRDPFMCLYVHSSYRSRFKRSSEKRKVFFFIVGAITSYFTLMSFSMIIPVFCAVYLTYDVDIKNDGNFSRSGLIVELVFWYCMGFCFMWAMKWIFLALYDRSLLGEVIESIRKRSSHDDYGDTITLWETILWNMCGYYYKNKALIWCILLASVEAISIIAISIRNRKNYITVKDGAVLATVVLVMLGRYAAIMNHRKVHYFFINRLLSGIVYIVLTIGVICISNGIKDIRNKKKTEQTS